MKLFTNAGCGQCVLLEQHNDTVLVAAIDKNEFVVANNLHQDGSWAWGDYFGSLPRALAEYKRRIK